MAYWLYPANTRFYDALNAFSEKSAYWPAKSRVAVGDTVLIYLAAPYKQIGFSSRVAQIDLELAEVFDTVSPFFKQMPDRKENDKPFMRLVDITAVKVGEESRLTLARLKEFGLKGMLMGPKKLDNSPELLTYVQESLK